MSAGNEPAQAAIADIELSDEQVRAYLKDNSDFLQRNPDMLDHLHISHASGSAVSLVEKQVSVLRERNMEMRHRLNSLTANARANDKLYDQTRQLVLSLLDARDQEQLYKNYMQSMAEDFKVEHASMILFGEPDTAVECRIESIESAKIEIGGLLRGNKPVCGVLRKEELSYLFPDAGDVGSAALVPLVKNGQVGILAVGSSDANKYSSNMDTLFLSHIAEVVARLLPKLQAAD
ncbi:DUF484 family protein [Halioglobus maricola]|uniref:DUF484 family protein n=1 Tax=Halioglobus maricola TaxID=2601894 RepID=A0A5P9NNQ7_9GAMM|nr:DUF484 family protein [Halioglobus maricola]QFU77126.1 DUF484 family protein [Halioglobus maricola]